MNHEEWAYRWATTPTTARANVWRAHRVECVLAGDTPRPLTVQPTVVVHVLPPGAFTTAADLPNILAGQLPIVAQIDGRIRANVDGIVAIGTDVPGYVQVFRDHTVEYASSDLLTLPGVDDLAWEPISEFLTAFLGRLHERVYRLAQEGEWTYALSLLHVNGRGFADTAAHDWFDRDTVLLPPVSGPESGAAAAQLRRLLRQATGTMQ